MTPAVVPTFAFQLRWRLALGLLLAGPVAYLVAIVLSTSSLSKMPGKIDRSRADRADRLMRESELGLQSGWIDAPEFLTGPGVDLVRVFGSPIDGPWVGSTVLATEVKSGWPLRCLVGFQLARVTGQNRLATDAVYTSAVPNDTAHLWLKNRAPIVPLRLIWGAFPVNILAMWPITFLALSTPLLTRRTIRALRRRCPACGYARTIGRPCPECGADAAAPSI